jgi:uncharacterized protein (TIGR02598 family)
MGHPKRTSLPRHRNADAGFTLVEVALAIGIVAFAFVALLALLPAGNTAFRRAIDVAVCGQISQRIINEAQQSDFRALIDIKDSTGRTRQQQAPDADGFTFRAPKRSEPAYRYFDDQGREVILRSGTTPTPEEKARIVYQVNTRIMTRAPVPRAPLPPGVNASIYKTEQPLALVTVQVAQNPNLIDIPLSTAPAAGEDPTRNLWVPTAKQSGIAIYTYAALVGRNE